MLTFSRSYKQFNFTVGLINMGDFIFNADNMFHIILVSPEGFVKILALHLSLFNNNYLLIYFIRGPIRALVFGLNFTKQARMKLGYTIQPQYRICQHERDLGILERIILTMGCGVIVKPSGDRDRYSTSYLWSSNINDLSTIVIPFFQQHRLYGAKGLDFQDFAPLKEGVAIMKKKGHLTSPPSINDVAQLRS